jgi:hypothetical protein
MPFEPKKGSIRHDIPNKKTSFFVGTILVILRGRFVWEFQILVLVKKKEGLKKN